MATENKDFKVKNGIQVSGNGTFVGTVSAATPTLETHLVTKSYVDELIESAAMQVGAIPPEEPVNGMLWFDVVIERINVYYEGQWITVATIDDTLNIPDHIHDTSIDGNGLMVTRFVDARGLNDPQGTGVDGQAPETIDWNDTFDGGLAIDNYN